MTGRWSTRRTSPSSAAKRRPSASASRTPTARAWTSAPPSGPPPAPWPVPTAPCRLLSWRWRCWPGPASGERSGASPRRNWPSCSPTDMEVRGLGWLGTRTERWAELVAFYKDVLGLRAVVDGTEFAVFELPDGSQVEVFGPSMEKCAHFATGPVTGFLVDDLPKARAEMEGSGV